MAEPTQAQCDLHINNLKKMGRLFAEMMDAYLTRTAVVADVVDAINDVVPAINNEVAAIGADGGLIDYATGGVYPFAAPTEGDD